MNVKGTMKLIHVRWYHTVCDVFDITGFAETYCQSNDCGCKDTELHAAKKEDSIYLN